MLKASNQTSPVSVLMPAYNAERHIAASIESVLAQTHAAFELLVIDDGSKDKTFEIARSYAARDPRVKAITQPNAGIAHTMNRGIEMSAGEWVFCMHADDLMMPNRLERQLAFIEANPDVSVASSLVYYINDKGETVGTGRSPFTDPAAVERTIKNGEVLAFNHPATVMRRAAVVEAGGYRQEFWPAEDIDLWNRIVERGHRVAVQDEILLKYRIHGSSASISKARLMQQKAIWMEQCVACRRGGATEPTWQQFIDARRGASLGTRIANWRREVGRTFYQSAMHHYATRNRYRFVPAILGAAALEPSLVLSRILPRLLPKSRPADREAPSPATVTVGTST
jgi:glycosyltransferase involved in cell wall biosynthesis